MKKLFFHLLIMLIPLALHAGHPRLLFNQEQLSSLKEKAKTEEGKAIIDQLRKRLQSPPDPLWVGSYAAGHAFLYLLYDDSLDLRLSKKYALLTIHDSIPFVSEREQHQGNPIIPLWNSSYKAIYRTPNVVGLALAYDLAYNHWEENFRIQIAKEIADKAQELIQGGGVGYNSSPWSNWQGITKGGGGFGAMAVMGDPEVSFEISETFQLAKAGLKKHLDYLSEKGWTPEGFDYLRYELNTGVLPFLQAYQYQYHQPFYPGTKTDFFLQFYVMQSIVRDHQLFVPMYGLGGNAWNVNRWRSGDWVMGMGITDKKYLPSIIWTFDQVFGMNGDKSFDIFKPHDAIFALLNYPINVSPINPSTVLPKVWVDQDGGYFVFRNEWKDKNDIVVTITTNRLAKPASHSHQEAGSFRIFGLGHNWATRPEKNNALKDQRFENRVYIEEATSWLGARCTYFNPKEDGSATLSLNMDSAYFGGKNLKSSFDLGIKASRSFAVDFSKKSGADAVIIIEDKIKADLNKSWIMHTDFDKIKVDRNSFKIENNNALMIGYFISPKNAELSFTYENKELEAKNDEDYLLVLILSEKDIPQPVIKNRKKQKIIAVGKASYKLSNGNIIF